MPILKPLGTMQFSVISSTIFPHHNMCLPLYGLHHLSAPDPGPPYLDHYFPYLQNLVVNSQYSMPSQQYPPIYPPRYDTCQVHPAQSNTRERIFRKSPIPVEIPPTAVLSYILESREGYQQVEGYYLVPLHPAQIRPAYPKEPPCSLLRLPPPPQSHSSLDKLHCIQKEIMAQLEGRKVIFLSPFAPSPTLLPTSHQEKFLDDEFKTDGKFKGYDYSQKSPWPCATACSYIGTKDAKRKNIVAAQSVETKTSVSTVSKLKYQYLQAIQINFFLFCE